MADSAAPRIARSVNLRFQGDWGQAHLTRVCCWLMHQFGQLAGPHSQGTIRAGRGGWGNVAAVGRGEVDVALTTPTFYARTAQQGLGAFSEEHFPELRALGTIPQDDRLVVALDANLGITSFAELRERKPALRLTTAPNDGESPIGWAVHALMAEAGIDDETFASWGGTYVEHEIPTPCIKAYEHGEVDGLIQEALTTRFWVEATDKRDTAFIPVEDDVLDRLEEKYGWPRKPLAAGYLRGLDEDLQTPDYSDFAVLVRSDMPDDVAYLLAWCMTETKLALEQLYHHRDPKRSGISYPMDPVKMGTTPIALHDGAAAAYGDLGYLPAS